MYSFDIWQEELYLRKDLCIYFESFIQPVTKLAL